MDTDMSVLAYIWSFVGLVLVAESVFSSRRPAFGRRMVDNTFARRNPVDINLTGQDYQVHQVHQAQKPFVILGDSQQRRYHLEVRPSMQLVHLFL